MSYEKVEVRSEVDGETGLEMKVSTDEQIEGTVVPVAYFRYMFIIYSRTVSQISILSAGKNHMKIRSVILEPIPDIANAGTHQNFLFILGSSTSSGLGIRHLITVILSACLLVNYVLRVNLSVAVVSMTDSNRNDSYPVFDWSPEEKGLLLSSFFTGYLVSNMVAGVVVMKYSNTKILACSVAYNSLISTLTPVLVTWGGYSVMFTIRVSMGLVQGFMLPAVHGFLSRWIPLSERSRCGSIVFGGVHLGTIVSFTSSGLLSDSPWGWPSVFYFSAIITGLWCLAWIKYAADGPEQSKLISEEEKMYIKSMIIDQAETTGVKKAIPWKMIIKNKVIYGLLFTMIGNNWGIWILLTQIPTYFSHVLHLNTSQNGALSAMPFVCLWLISFPVSFLSDYLISRKILSITATRKLFNSFGQWGPGMALLCLAYTTSTTLAIAFYTIAVTMIACTFVGFNLTPLDISPNYAGFLMGMTNGIAHITAIAGPAFTGFMVKPLDNVEGWKLVFLVASIFYFFGNAAFLILCSAEVQDFNNFDEPKPEIDAEKAEKEPLNT